MAEDHRRSDGQSIARAVAILRALAEHPGASFGQLAAMTGLPRSTVQRLVGVLAQERLVVKAFGQQGAWLGMELARLGARVRLDVRALMRPFLQALHARFPDNLDLTMREGARIVVIEQLASHDAIRVTSYVGKELPWHCTAAGKAHLSLLAPEQAMAVLSGGLQAFTPRTETDPARVLAGVAAAEGVFADRDEYGEGASAMAVALPPLGGAELALAIAMPTPRFLRLGAELAPALLTLRAEVEAAYGAGL